MQRKKAHRTLPRFPRLIPTVFPVVVMIERCRPLCSLKSLTKNPAWAVNAASSFSAQYLEKLLNIWMKFDKHKSICLLRFVDSHNSIASGEEEEELFTITNSTKSLEGSSGSAMLHLIENSDNERSRLHFSKRALSTCFRRPSDMRSLWDWGQHANLVGASCINIGSQNELMSPAKKGSLQSTIHFLWNTF